MAEVAVAARRGRVAGPGGLFDFLPGVTVRSTAVAELEDAGDGAGRDGRAASAERGAATLLVRGRAGCCCSSAWR